MTTTKLLARRRFLPLFVTQLFNAFNDNLYKNAMVLFVVFSVYNSEQAETLFSGAASLVFILPFFLLSGTAGQLADMRDKAWVIRRVKAAEILIMSVGAVGLYLGWRGTMVESLAIPLMMLALFAMGIHSTFFGPIKYAILPQHLRREEVLAGTGLVEAGTYVAILMGTVLGGVLDVEIAAIAVILVAIIGWITSLQVPSAPPMEKVEPIDLNLWRASVKIIRRVREVRQVWLAIVAISFFWTIGAVLFVQFPPLVKNVLYADKEVATLFLVIFSVGVSIGSVTINRLLKGDVSVRFSPQSVTVMAGFVFAFYLLAKMWPEPVSDGLVSWQIFMAEPLAVPLLLSLLGVAIMGGMFVVPLYAFLTTKIPTSEASRAVAANNIVNAGGMVLGSLASMVLSMAGVPITEQLLMTASMCLFSAWLGRNLHRAEVEEAALAPS